jgi:hypothetical protein
MHHHAVALKDEACPMQRYMCTQNGPHRHAHALPASRSGRSNTVGAYTAAADGRQTCRMQEAEVGLLIMQRRMQRCVRGSAACAAATAAQLPTISSQRMHVLQQETEHSIT